MRDAVELEDMAETCALDVADQGGLSLGEVADLFGLSRERIRQLEMLALEKLRGEARLVRIARQAEVLPTDPLRPASPAVRKVRPKPKAAPSRLPAPVVARRGGSPKPRRGRLEAGSLVACNRFEALIPLKTCLQRQDARWPGKRAPIHDYCGSGQCAQGTEYRLRAAYSAAEDWAGKSKAGKAAYQFFRKDAGVQRQKRRAQVLSRPEGEVPTIDTPPGSRGGPEPLDLADPEVQEVLAVAGV